MKFYKDKINSIYYWVKIRFNKLTSIHCECNAITFFKNGFYHNSKNYAISNVSKYKKFYLNGNFYGNQNKFTKQSWRKFVKLQAFL